MVYVISCLRLFYFLNPFQYLLSILVTYVIDNYSHPHLLGCNRSSAKSRKKIGSMCGMWSVKCLKGTC